MLLAPRETPCVRFKAVPGEGRNTIARQLGKRYMLETRIGGGATGEVWRGHILADGGSIAVKMLKPHLARDRAVITAFIRERDILEGLKHPRNWIAGSTTPNVWSCKKVDLPA